MRNAILTATFTAMVALGATACADVESFDEGLELGSAESELAVAITPAEIGDDFPNPERGMYTGYNLRAGRDASSIRAAGFTLAIAIVNLQDYRTRSLDSALLTSLAGGFARARAAGIKLIVRFVYNEDGGADASKARILGHIGQLKAVLNANADVIAVVQAGFIGGWGEWHSSTNGLDNTAARAEIIAALLAATPWNRAVQLRTPMFKDAYRPGPLTAAEAYLGSSRSRLGHHNDCFLASSSDYGTYASPVTTWTAYLAADSLFAPVGGETCAVYTPRTNCATALSELTRLHWSYLNNMYKPEVLSGWTSGGCMSTIRKNLGYRFVLGRIVHTDRVAPGGVLDLSFDLKNRGFAAPMNSRPVDVVLIKGSSRYTARLAFDARRTPSGFTTTVATRLRVPANLPTGTYTLAVRLPDALASLAGDPRYAIRLANAGVWDAATGDNVLTRSLVIDGSAPGTRDASAAGFVELVN